MADDDTAQNPATIRIGDTLIRRCRWGVMMYSRLDSVIGRALTLYGEFAEDAHVLLRHFVRPGDTVVDVGANVGTVALFLSAAVGPGGMVHAFEPQPAIFHYLCGNVALNGRRNVDCVQAALGRAEGTGGLPPVDYAKPGNFGAVRLASGGAGEVAVTTLDALGLEACALLKIDVEGMEIDVLEGAAGLLERCRPVVYTENKKGPDSARVIEFLLARGYALHWHFARFYRADNFRGEPKNVFGDSGDINMLCLPPGHPAKANLPRVEGPDADWFADLTAWMERSRASSTA